MKILKVTKEQSENLGKEIAEFVNKIKMSLSVECIYMIPYESEWSNQCQISLIVVKDKNRAKQIESIIDASNTFYRTEDCINRFGVQIIPICDSIFNYYEDNMRTGYLHNGIILFDRKGSFTEMKEQEMKDRNLEFTNLCELKPYPLVLAKKKISRVS